MLSGAYVQRREIDVIVCTKGWRTQRNGAVMRDADVVVAVIFLNVIGVR